MLTMPSLWSLTVSTLVFIAASWYLYRYLDAQGIQKGFTRGMVVLTFATLLSWGAGMGTDWAERKITGHQATAQPAVPPQVQPELAADTETAPSNKDKTAE